MSAVTCLSDHPMPIGKLPSHQDLAKVRVSGGVRVAIDAMDGVSRIADVRERDGFKVRFPRRANPPEAILINTGGGLASGDTIRQDFAIADNAALTVTTQASERVYRALGNAMTRFDVTATVGAGGKLFWLPQETILFDRARLKRTISIDMAASACTLITETVVLGRAAMGETFDTGLFLDSWRIRRGGRLVFAENVRLDDLALRAMPESAVAGGAHVISTTILVAPDAEDRLCRVRDVLERAPYVCAASAWNGLLVVRGLAHKNEPARRLMAELTPALGIEKLPRVWWT